MGCESCLLKQAGRELHAMALFGAVDWHARIFVISVWGLLMKSYSLQRRIRARLPGCPPLRNPRVTFCTSRIFAATSQFFWIHIGRDNDLRSQISDLRLKPSHVFLI